MPVRQRIKDDSVESFLKAASQRWKDAEVLRKANRRLAAIYLFGYSTEMVVKAAYFAAFHPSVGQPLNTPITENERKKAVGEHMILGVPVKPSGHDIAGWAQLLVAKRRALSVAYAHNFGIQLVNEARRLQNHWKETLRYHSLSIYTAELREVRIAALWFHKNRQQMMR